MNKKVLKIYDAVRDDIADLITFRAMPTTQLKMIDPFLFLNHHGLQNYPPGNDGLPFAAHPHRGFETVTFILSGDVAHKDSKGHESIIQSGGIQWMTAGRGIIHEEVSSEMFKKSGGALELLQLWINLPSRLKMSSPKYKGLQQREIPHYNRDGVKVILASGTWENQKGPFETLTEVTTMLVELTAESSIQFEIPTDNNVFFYIVEGSLNVNGCDASEKKTVLFGEGKTLNITSVEGARLLLCHAPPLDEPVASYGPFVMNTKQEIIQAIQDYQNGLFN